MSIEILIVHMYVALTAFCYIIHSHIAIGSKWLVIAKLIGIVRNILRGGAIE